MALKPCIQCKQMIADTAKTCPHCGAPIMSKENALIVLGCFVTVILIIIVILVMVWTSK